MFCASLSLTVCLSCLTSWELDVVSPCSFHQHKELSLASCTNYLRSGYDMLLKRESLWNLLTGDVLTAMFPHHTSG